LNAKWLTPLSFDYLSIFGSARFAGNIATPFFSQLIKMG
jgi:hypothetical protein